MGRNEGVNNLGKCWTSSIHDFCADNHLSNNLDMKMVHVPFHQKRSTLDPEANKIRTTNNEYMDKTVQ